VRRISLALLLVALTGCQPDAPRWNVVVVTFDTTRADMLGCYGNTGIRTPVLDQLAAEGSLFEEAVVPVPITLPSHASLMTGKVPFAHGVRDNGIFALGDEQTTLAEVLRDAGYGTAAAVGSYPLKSEFGIGQGFELFDDHLTAASEDVYGERAFPKQRLFFDERKAARVNEAILPWLREHHREPFFLWTHYFDPHHPHEPPAPYNQAYTHDLYAGEIAYADESLGTLLRQLEQLNVAERTLVVFTSDHGEGRGEHDESTHSMLVYNATLHVPLIVKVPGAPAGLRISQRVSTIDVVPTVLDFLGLKVPSGIQGISLRPYLEGAASSRRRAIYAETLSPRLTRNWGDLRTLLVGDEKYIHGPRPELYNLRADPREVHDLAAEQPAAAERLRGQLEAFLAEHVVADLDSSVALDEESARRLQALGYLQASGEKVGPLEEVLRQDGDPPQDHAATITVYSQVKNLLFRDQPVEAKEFLVGLLRTDPENAHYLELMANAELKLGRTDAALKILDALSRRPDGYPPPEKTLDLMATVLMGQGDLDTAYDKLRQSQAIALSAAGQYRLAKIHEARNEIPDARRFFERTLELDENFVPALLDLAVGYAAAGDLESAEAFFAQAFQGNPYHPRIYYNYAVFLLHSERQDDALTYLRRAVELKPDYLPARYALVELLAGLDELKEAEAHLEALALWGPGSRETQLARELLESF
jgi:arylsulfatase A-like enzyme/Tfp pilus assembly protein PilF